VNGAAEWVYRWVLMICVAGLAHCQAGSRPEAIPCTPRLRDFEVQGPVKTLLVDIPLRWDEQQKKMVSGSDGIELYEFNPRGYLTRRSLGSMRNGQPNTYPFQVYKLDEKDRVVEFEGDTIESGGPAFRVRYEYVRADNAIDIKAAKVDVFGGRGAPFYRTYRQEFDNTTARVLIYNHGGTVPPVMLYRIDVYESGMLVTSTSHGSGEPTYQQSYVKDRIVEDKRLAPSRYRDSIAEERWTYADGFPWPPSKITSWEDGRKALYEYEYVLDDRGNWTTKNEYLVENGKRVLLRLHKRQLTYY
jgi:hypothetical protein